MRARDRLKLEKALATIRDPDGTGRTKVSHGFTGQPMTCVRCHEVEKLCRCAVVYRCQFCGEGSPKGTWTHGGDGCPKCGRTYDAMLALRKGARST